MPQEAVALAECSSESPQVVRDDVQQKLSHDVASFLSNGGNVQQVENNVRSDPPKKPSMNYGSAPI